MHTLDHLAGVANRAAIHYTGESQLREVGIQKHTYASLSISKHQEAKEYQKRKKAKGAICKNFSVKHSKINYNIVLERQGANSCILHLNSQDIISNKGTICMQVENHNYTLYKKLYN